MMMTDNMVGNTLAPNYCCLRVTATWFGDDKDKESSDGSSSDKLYVLALVENTEVCAIPAPYLTVTLMMCSRLSQHL